MTTRYIVCLSILISAIGCQQEKKSDNGEHKAFEPSGYLSDLVYNPVNADGTIDSSYLPILVLQDSVFDFGEIFEGDVVYKEFHFSNTGTAPLLIYNASSSCGCTVPEWPEKPVLPDSTGLIRVKFDAKNKEGAQNKQVTIFANTIPNRHLLTVRGHVKKK